MKEEEKEEYDSVCVWAVLYEWECPKCGCINTEESKPSIVICDSCDIELTAY